MEKFDLVKTPAGDQLRTSKTGREMLRLPLYDKGTGFTYEERRELEAAGVEDEGLLDRAAALHLDLLGQIRKSVGGVDEIFARQQRRWSVGPTVNPANLSSRA